MDKKRKSPAAGGASEIVLQAYFRADNNNLPVLNQVIPLKPPSQNPLMAWDRAQVLRSIFELEKSLAALTAYEAAMLSFCTIFKGGRA